MPTSQYACTTLQNNNAQITGDVIRKEMTKLILLHQWTTAQLKRDRDTERELNLLHSVRERERDSYTDTHARTMNLTLREINLTLNVLDWVSFLIVDVYFFIAFQCTCFMQDLLCECIYCSCIFSLSVWQLSIVVCRLFCVYLARLCGRTWQ